MKRIIYTLLFLGCLFQYTNTQAQCTDCAYTLTATDSFGDGWNGAAVTATSSLGSVNVGLAAGSGPENFKLLVADGDNVTVTKTANGTFAGEVGLTVTGPTGDTPVTVAFGAFPGFTSANFTAVCNAPAGACPLPAGSGVANYQFNLMDSFGDGWNGANIAWSVESVADVDPGTGLPCVYASGAVGTGFTTGSAFAEAAAIPCFEGAQIVWTYNAGGFPGEESYTGTDPDGAAIGGPSGTTPPTRACPNASVVDAPIGSSAIYCIGKKEFLAPLCVVAPSCTAGNGCTVPDLSKGGTVIASNAVPLDIGNPNGVSENLADPVTGVMGTLTVPVPAGPAGSVFAGGSIEVCWSGDSSFASESVEVCDAGGATIGVIVGEGFDCEAGQCVTVAAPAPVGGVIVLTLKEQAPLGAIQDFCTENGFPDILSAEGEFTFVDPTTAIVDAACINWYTSGTPGCGELVATGAALGIEDLEAIIASGCFPGASLTEPGTLCLYAEASCADGATSERVEVCVEVLDCSCDDGCPYFIVLNDAGGNGWDGASLDVTVNNGAPETIKVESGSSLVHTICVNDGGIIELNYWNGAFEDEHSYVVYDAFGNIANMVNGNPAQFGPTPPVGANHTIKAECPESCNDETEDFIVRITVGVFPEEHSWEIYEGGMIGNTTLQGPQVIGITANTYAGLAPGTQVLYNITLDKCKDYTFAAFDGINDGWNGGSWEILTANLDYGTEFRPNDPNAITTNLVGNSLVLTDSPAGDEDRVTFTIPCQPGCTEVLVANATAADCAATGVLLPITPPITCFPACNHALGCEIEVQHFVLPNGDPSLAVAGTAAPYTGSGSVVFDGDIGAIFGSSALFGGPGGIPVGCHTYVTKYTYCDGIMVKCTADLNVTTDANPSMTCNDNVLVSLAAPDGNDNNGSQSLTDDFGECVVEITPDMVLENPTSDCFNIFGLEEYSVTVLDENGNPLVVFADNGLPLDIFGFPIPAWDTATEPAHNLVGPAQLMQTLTYVVEHKFSGNKCWGTLTVEDKLDPIIVCNDYEIKCTHPEYLNENYTHTEVYTPDMELPANIAGGQAGLESNTFIPINVPCQAMGEIIQNIQVNLNLTHNDVTDLQVFLHAPAAFGFGALQLDQVGDVGTANTYVPNPVNDSPALLAFLGQPCMNSTSTSPESFITENSGALVPANAGGTWYIQVQDVSGTRPPGNPPFGGGQVTSASITLTCGFPNPVAALDCSLISLDLLDEELYDTQCDQSNWLGAYVERTYQATDKFGNTATCKQRTNLTAPSFDDLSIPSDVVIECGDEVLLADGSVDPTQAGGPHFGCFPVTEDLHGLCDITYVYEDLILPACGRGYKVQRTWTINNWCTGTTNEYVQLIKIEDSIGPDVAQGNITVGTGNYACTADIDIDDLGVTDNCSGVKSVSLSYIEPGSYINGGTLVIVNISEGESVEDLPIGTHTATIIAKDSCLNITEKDITITVVDDTPPIAICDDELHVSLGGDGEAWLYADDVDEGSYDNCGDVTLEVRRTDGCLGTTPWADSVPFECCDVDEYITVELRVTDAVGNSNICWKTVLVEDALPPTITTPADKTINCDDPAVHSPFGEAAADDNCNATITMSDSGELDQCKAGTLVRTFTATDGSAKSADVSGTQRITVVHVSDFVVQFPADVTLSDCQLEDAGEPTITDDDCELVAISSEDVVFDIVDDACYKIERTWTLVNWCVYTQGAPATDLGFPLPVPRTYRDDDGYFQYVQTIKVLDNDGPTIDCPGDQDFCDLTDGCEGFAELTISATDACSPEEALEYEYKIDAFNDGSFDIVANGTDASGVYPYGTHLIKWIVEDGCGNTSTCSYLFTVRDCKNPTPLCINGVSIPGMNSDGSVEIWANDLLDKAWDNCTEDAFVEASVKMRREGDTGALQDALTLTCDDVGTVIVEIWVSDDADGNGIPYTSGDNTDFCSTYIILQDNSNVCEGTGSSVAIAGDIETEMNEDIEGVMVNVDGGTASNALPTDGAGTFTFPALANNTTYMVTPEKDHDPLNGVTTFDLVLITKHILGTQELNSPYKMIAADINNDGKVTTADVIEGRRLILYIITDFTNNTSWRFVDAAYTFPQPTNPWAEAFPEDVEYSTLMTDEMHTDFVGVKIGDVNDNAVANNLLGSEERNTVGDLVFSVEDANMEAGQAYTVDFRAKDFNQVAGYQFTLNFDATAMNFAGIEAGELAVAAGNFGLEMINEGVITTSFDYAAGKTVNDDAVLFSVNFTATSSAVLSDVVSLSSRYTKAEAYNSDLELMDVAIEFNSVEGTSITGGNFELYQNRPNPFTNATVIGFNLPEAASATMKIYDVSGRILKVIEGDFSRGYNEVSIESGDLNSAGVLYYQLDTQNDSDTKKMILID